MDSTSQEPQYLSSKAANAVVCLYCSISLHSESLRSLNGFLDEFLAMIVDKTLQQKTNLSTTNIQRSLVQLIPVGTLARSLCNSADAALSHFKKGSGYPEHIDYCYVLSRLKLISTYYSHGNSPEVLGSICLQTAIWMATVLECVAKHIVKQAAEISIRNLKDKVRPQEILFILEKDSQISGMFQSMAMREFLLQVAQQNPPELRPSTAPGVSPLRHNLSEDLLSSSGARGFRSESYPITPQNDLLQPGTNNAARRRTSTESYSKEGLVSRIKSGFLSRSSMETAKVMSSPLTSPTSPTGQGFPPGSQSRMDKRREFEELISSSEIKKVSLTPTRLKDIEEAKPESSIKLVDSSRSFMKLFSSGKKKERRYTKGLEPVSSKDYSTYPDTKVEKEEVAPNSLSTTSSMVMDTLQQHTPSPSPLPSPSPSPLPSPLPEVPRRVRSRMQLTANVPTSVKEEEEEAENSDHSSFIKREIIPRKNRAATSVQRTNSPFQNSLRSSHSLTRSKSQEFPRSILKNTTNLNFSSSQVPPVPALPLHPIMYAPKPSKSTDALAISETIERASVAPLGNQNEKGEDIAASENTEILETHKLVEEVTTETQGISNEADTSGSTENTQLEDKSEECVIPEKSSKIILRKSASYSLLISAIKSELIMHKIPEADYGIWGSSEEAIAKFSPKAPVEEITSSIEEEKRICNNDENVEADTEDPETLRLSKIIPKSPSNSNRTVFYESSEASSSTPRLTVSTVNRSPSLQAKNGLPALVEYNNSGNNSPILQESYSPAAEAEIRALRAQMTMLRKELGVERQKRMEYEELLAIMEGSPCKHR